ncbi:hypothetical protein Sjap_001726 [Stephania japonica]|uniref:Uncharacterized protein n=1 Tax=Stephania japonica TaxID=461633 RepID=A0AAP0KKN1_9MAGN
MEATPSCFLSPGLNCYTPIPRSLASSFPILYLYKLFFQFLLLFLRNYLLD